MTRKHPPIRLRWVVFLALLLALSQPLAVAYAHPVDMYAQDQSILLGPDGLSLDWKIRPGPLLSDSVWSAADSDRNASVDETEARAWIAPFLAHFSVALDGNSLNDIKLARLHWPASLDAFRTGEDAIELWVTIPWPAGISGTHALALHNTYLEANSLSWFSVTTTGGWTFEMPEQNNGSLVLKLHDKGDASRLSSWNSGQPNLAGLGDALSLAAVNLAGQSQTPATGSAAVTSALVGLVKTRELSPLFLLGAWLLSLLLGSLHALTPGHGKTLVAAYLVGSKGRSRDAVFLGLVVTLTHTGSVLLLGLLTLFASHYLLPGTLVPWLEIVSGLLVVVFGGNLLFQRRQVLTGWLVSRRSRKSVGANFSLQTAQVGSGRAPGFGVQPLGHSHDDQDGFHHHEGHNHSHDLPSGAVTWRSLLTLGISGGLVPCPDAIAILLVAVAVNRLAFGMLLIVAFSLGLALVLIGLGIAMVQGARVAARSDLLNRFSLYTPLVSALVVVGLGIGLTVNAVNSFFFSAQASQPGGAATSFDTDRARLLYFFPDSRGKFQLAARRVTGGDVTFYTQETSGVSGYSLAPDARSIVYTVFQPDGETSLWLVDAEGADRRQLLVCKQAQCGGPVWYPDSQRLVYQRVDYAQDYALSRFSLWWLELASGDTRPVFQDRTFASQGPAFSPDGRWLSYKSASNNTLQIYNLQDGRSSAIPLDIQAGGTESWSPAGESLLFWERAGAQADAALHVKRYALGSGNKTDLGGEPSQPDYAASWSPDGAWVAIDRDLPLSAGSQSGDQVWLVRPTGGEARLLLGEQDASYSDLAWSPDGRFLVYTRYSYKLLGKSEIWMVDVQSGQRTRLVSGGMLPRFLP